MTDNANGSDAGDPKPNFPQNAQSGPDAAPADLAREPRPAGELDQDQLKRGDPVIPGISRYVTR